MNRIRLKTLILFVVIFSVLLTVNVSAESHRLFSELLAEHVHNGLVNYKTLKNDRRLDQYLAQLARTDPDTIGTTQGQLAFRINAYNAYTLRIICDNYPVKSVNDLHWGGLIIGTVLKKTVWDKDFVIVSHSKTTLNAVERKIVRPTFKESRAHFALVCASKGCPPLRSEAYEGDKLDAQLTGQAKQFFTTMQKIVLMSGNGKPIYQRYSVGFRGILARVRYRFCCSLLNSYRRTSLMLSNKTQVNGKSSTMITIAV